MDILSSIDEQIYAAAKRKHLESQLKLLSLKQFNFLNSPMF